MNGRGRGRAWAGILIALVALGSAGLIGMSVVAGRTRASAGSQHEAVSGWADASSGREATSIPGQSPPGHSATVLEPPAASAPAEGSVPHDSNPGGDRHAATLPRAPSEGGTIRLGMEGPAVDQLQQRLNELGYTIAAVDGVFGAETLHALVAFQKVSGLARDGVVGPLTAEALEEATRPVARSAGSGFHVEVDVPRQVLYLVRDGVVADVYDVSTGTEGPYEFEGREYVAHTPTGSFQIQRKIDGLREAPLGTLYRPAYFYGGYAIHGSPSVPAYPASHGCVRVTDQVMDRIFDLLAIGTPVFVYA